MNKEELVSQYVDLRRQLEKLHRECECVEVEIREVERELMLSETQTPSAAQIDALINIPERRASQPR